MDERNSNTGPGGPELEEIVSEAEQRFSEGLRILRDWGAQARQVIEKQPAAVLAGVAILGFVTGLLLRRVGRPEDRA